MKDRRCIVNLLLIAIILAHANTSAFAQGPCFEDCFGRMNKSTSPFAALDILSEIQGCQAPDFEVETIDGDIISSKSLDNSVIVMNFWFIGCKPCIQEMPRLNELVDHYSGRDVIFLSFAKDSKDEIETKFLPKRVFKYKIVPGKYDMSKKYCVTVYPTHVVIGKSGAVEFAGFSSVDKEEIYQQLKSSIDNALEKE